MNAECIGPYENYLRNCNRWFDNWIRNVTFVNQVFIVGKQLTGPSFHYSIATAGETKRSISNIKYILQSE